MSEAPFNPGSWAITFLQELLERWLEASVTKNGIFYPYLDYQWRPKDQGPCTLVTQCRLIYNFSRAFILFGGTRYAAAARHGLQALESYFRLPAGGYRWSVNIDGEEHDASLDSYGHAFCILAQSTAASALKDVTMAERAMTTWRFVSQTFSDEYGGLRWRIGPAREWEQTSRSQNPLMHLFESLMALAQVDQSGLALESASRLLSFMRKLSAFTAGALLERHTADWKPLAADAVIDLGHQFEWAFLLSEWHLQTGDRQALQQGAAFLETGINWGLTKEDGVRASCDPAGDPISNTIGLWEQCEAIRAISRYAKRHGRINLQPVLERSLAFYRERFIDPQCGGVFASLDGEGHPGASDKGNHWKLDYHSTNMCLELIGEVT